ncbi:MAG TPA: cytochrome P460 family protein [Woeseiaceae bacterium]|nr:cytochrome P460 family protein [Woeseiaceae bacterium]
MTATARKTLPILIVAALGATACQPESPAEPPGAAETEPASAPAAGENPAGYPGPDPTGAAVWAHLQGEDYRESWSFWPGRGELYEGREPHGMLLTTYVNDAALGAVEEKAGRMPPGAMIVKENYTPEEKLASVTVMYKAPGFNPDHNDWFFAKYRPDGSVAETPDGTPQAGRVPGCQACHEARKTNDYLYTGRIRTEGM